MTKHIRGHEIRFLYSICFFVFSLFYLPLFIIKGKHKEGFLSRFGYVPKPIQEKLFGKKVIWVHAVSVGEVVQAVRLVGLLKEKLGHVRFVITTTTSTGQEVARKAKQDETILLYFPIDFGFSVSSFLNATSPTAVIVLETEIWPNLIFELSKRRIPVFLMNARISDRALGQYRKVRRWMGPLLNRFEAIGAQDDLMRARFLALGATPARVSVTGNMKFDWRPPAAAEALLQGIERNVRDSQTRFFCVAVSTHRGEEAMLFDIYKSIRAHFKDFRLLIAPRHLDRMAEIQKEAAEKEIRLMKASDALIERSVSGESREVLILDAMGVLSNLYQLADAVFIGGSLVPVGGHNLVEPAFFERPVLFGPFMNNFREMAEMFKKENAGVEVKTAAELEDRLIQLMQDPAKRRSLGTLAKQLIQRHEGATDRNIQLFLKASSIQRSF